MIFSLVASNHMTQVPNRKHKAFDFIGLPRWGACVVLDTAFADHFVPTMHFINAGLAGVVTVLYAKELFSGEDEKQELSISVLLCSPY